MTMLKPREELLTTKELAAALKRSRRYVQWMKSRGFRMVGGTATLSEAREFLALHPVPCSERREVVSEAA